MTGHQIKHSLLMTVDIVPLSVFPLNVTIVMSRFQTDSLHSSVTGFYAWISTGLFPHHLISRIWLIYLGAIYITFSFQNFFFKHISLFVLLVSLRHSLDFLMSCHLCKKLLYLHSLPICLTFSNLTAMFLSF